MKQLVAVVVLFVLSCAAGGDAVRLQPGVAVKGSTTDGNQAYTFELPPEAVLMTVAITNLEKGKNYIIRATCK